LHTSIMDLSAFQQAQQAQQAQIRVLAKTPKIGVSSMITGN